MSTKRERAQQAARLGFDVFPVAPNDKKPPLISNWPNLATQDPKQIDAWWDEWPDANIGGSMRDKLVFDIDKRNGGWDTWGALLAIEHFPKTRGSTTAGGGAHLIYQMPEGEKATNGVHKAGQGIDIKGFGGYIVLPGSTIDGKKYEWDNNLPVAFAPEWAIERYKNAKERTAAAGKRVVEEDDIAVELFTKWIREHAPRAELGEIDDTTFAVAARGYDFGCSEATVCDLVSIWNETHCDGLGDLERLPVVVNSAGVNRDKPIGCAHPLASGFAAVEIAERPAQKTESFATPKTKFFAVRADEGARTALQSRGEPLIKGIIHCRTMSVVIGAPGEGKTFLVLDWAYHIARGQPWAGKRVKQGAVVYLAAEAGNMIMSRLAALEAHHGPLGDAPLYVVPCGADFAHGADDAKAILALIRDIEARSGQKVELFVVDTLSRAIAGGDENSSKDMGALIQSVDFIREQARCHVTVIHHPNKAGTGGGRGHSNVLGGTDTEIQIADKTIAFTKQRDMPMGPEIKFKLKPIHLGTDADGESITSCVVQVAAPGEAEVRVELTGRLRDVWDMLSAALKDADRTTFDMAFLKKVPFRHSSDIGPNRVTLIGWMSELSESGFIKKDKRGQWVTVNVGNVGELSD